MTRNSDGSPGSHPHLDQPNWQPATTLGEYVANCREGLENYSERRLAKLLGMSRTELQRAVLLAEIPEELFENLITDRQHQPSPTELAYVARALKGTGKLTEVDSCPHCGHTLRVRRRVSEHVAATVNEWLNTAAE